MKHFIKEWGLFTLFFTLAILSRLFIWIPVTVDGHSMDPTLADREKLIVIKTAKIERFDIVVADETDDDGTTKKVVKRVIGMPGDTISYNSDILAINGEEVNEPYLQEYRDLFAKDKLQSTYSYNKFFQELAAQAPTFTHRAGQTAFSVTVPENHYYLLGDDRLVSKDSREVGTFSRGSIVGEATFRFWPFSRIGTID